MRDLTRLELITEAVRAVLQEVVGTSPHLLDKLVDEGWGLRALVPDGRLSLQHVGPLCTARTHHQLATSVVLTHDSQVLPGIHTRLALPRTAARRAPGRRRLHLSASPDRPCPARTQCTSTADSARTVGSAPRELRDLQLRVRTEQQTPEWKTRCAVRSGAESTVNEFAHGHGLRRCHYRDREGPASGQAHPLHGQSRCGRRDIAGHADQHLVDRQQCEDFLLKTGDAA